MRTVFSIRSVCAFVICLTLTACAHVPGSQAPEQADIYLLMGQSNMSGRGVVSQLPAGALPVDPAIMLYGNDGQWHIAKEPLDSADGQVDKVSSDAKLPGVGPGLAFAHALKKLTHAQKIALVPCAKGGSALKEWTPDTARSTLYGSCLARAHEVMAKGTIKGVLWYQGETDAASEAEADLWLPRMVDLIGKVRTDIGSPCLSWVVVGLSDKPDPMVQTKPYPAWAKIQAFQAGLTQRVPHLAHVSAAGLPQNPDTLHLNTAGQLRLGVKLAGVMATLQDLPCQP
jgi:hypothetical protein